MTDFNPMEMFLLLSGRSHPEDISEIKTAADDEFILTEPVTRDGIIDFACSLYLFNENHLDKAPESTQQFFNTFQSHSEDCFLDEHNRLKLVLRNDAVVFTDMMTEGKLSFDNCFSFWDWHVKASPTVIQPHCYSLNPFLFCDEKPTDVLKYHFFVVSRFNCPEFLKLYKTKTYGLHRFLLSTPKDYIELLGFLCLLFTRKQVFRQFEYTDTLLFQIIPNDGRLGTNGINFSLWLDEVKNHFSAKQQVEIVIDKKMTADCYTIILPKTIEVLHTFAWFFIRLYEKKIELYSSKFQANIEFDKQYPFD
jgi:hypothetical protein